MKTALSLKTHRLQPLVFFVASLSNKN
ncbi:not available [Salmonella enterica subsp. enterica serovar Typhimurium]|nr:not available [Salmonella enterica subsp. enterica serovar Typhimurium]